MNRDSLIEKKNRTEEEKRKVTNILRNARREFAATGRGLQRTDLANLEARESYLTTEVNKINYSLGSCKDGKKAMGEAIRYEFMNVAKIVLDDDVFAKILKRAGDLAADNIRGDESER